MFESTRAFFKALNEKRATKNKLQLYDLSGKNPVKSERYSANAIKMEKLTNDIRIRNIKVYSKSMAELIGKKAILATPIVLGGLTIASFVNGKFIKTINVSDVYRDTIVEFDENSLLSNSETTYAKTDFKKDYVDDSIVSKSGFDYFDKSSYATIYYGEGSNSLQVKFDINDDNTWEYSSHTNNLYQKSENLFVEPIGELDEEYKELIKDATETFIKQANLSEEEIAVLREIISNNENDITVKIKRFATLASRDLEVHGYHWVRCVMAVIAEIVLIFSLFDKFWDLLYVYELEVVEYSIQNRNISISLLKATKQYREQFLIAEKNRISLILELLRNNGGNEEVINTFEKRLTLINKDQSRLTDDL